MLSTAFLIELYGLLRAILCKTLVSVSSKRQKTQSFLAIGAGISLTGWVYCSAGWLYCEYVIHAPCASFF